MPERRASQQKKHEYWVREWQHRREVYRSENELYGKLIDFVLDQMHYKRNRSMDNSSQRIQPRGQQLTNLVRHKTGLLVTPPLSVEARPVQPMADADAAIVTRRVVEQVVESPRLLYKNTRHRMVLTGIAAGRGVVAIEWDHNVNSVVFRNVDARKFFPAPGFLDLHDPRMPDVIEEVPMRMSAIRRMGWNVPSDLTADNATMDYANATGQGDSGKVYLDGDDASRSSWDDAGTEDDGIVTVLKCYSRRDPFDQTRVAKVPRDLDESEWYWTDDAGARLPVVEFPQPPDPSLRLVTKAEDERELELYPEGSLCIVAPYYGGKKLLWEGSWMPDAVNADVRMRSFPFMEFCPYLHPLRRAGKSDGEMNHSLQVIDNASMRAAWEQMRTASAIMTVMRGSLFDANNRQFEMDDRPFQIAYAADRMALDGIKVHQAPGMNSAMPAFRSMLDRQWSYIGTGDIAMPADRSRDVAVGTIEAMQKMGDLPVQMHRDLLNTQESIAYGIVLDFIRAYMDDATLVQWVTDKGELASVRVRGADLVDANVVLSAAPDWRALDSDRIQAVAQFVGQMQQQPLLMAAMAPLAGIPPEGVRAIQAAVAQQMQMMQAGPQAVPQGAGQAAA